MGLQEHFENHEYCRARRVVERTYREWEHKGDECQVILRFTEFAQELIFRENGYTLEASAI